MFLHREVLKQSWQVVWRNKYLWFFGFFAVFFSGNSGIEIVTRGLGIDTNTTSLFDYKMLSETGVLKLESISNIFKLMVKEPFSMLMVLFILLLVSVLVLFVLWLSNVSQAAIVNNTFYLTEGKKTDFQQGISAGIKNFWPVFGLNFIKKVLILGLFALMTLPLLLSEGAVNMVPGNIAFSLFFVFLVPAIVALAFVINFAISFVVIRKESFNKALRHSMKLFKKNWLVSIEMGFLIYFVGIIATLGAILIILMLVTPFFLLTVLAMNIQSVGLFSLVIALAFIFFTLIVILVGSLLSSFQNVANTIFFMKLVGEGASSKLVRVFDKKNV